MLRLVEPTPLYKAAIVDAAAEMHAVGECDITPDAFAAQFDAMLAEIAAAKDEATAPPGVLPFEDFWLMEDGTWIGLLTLRSHINEQFLHSGGHIGYVVRPTRRRSGYGTALLNLGLDKARERGLDRVLLTCNETNTASRKIIEANGGRFENAVDVEGQADKKLRFWIDLGTEA